MKSACLIGLIFFSSLALATPSLEMSSKAPALHIEQWLQGKPIERFESGKIYIVEFWATWCPPCIDSIPHLNAIAKKYAGEVTVIGVAATEDAENGNPLEGVKEILRNGRAPIEYPVAFDSSGTMDETWLDAAGVDGIPTAFVIDRQGQIAFIGHPHELDDEETGNALQLILEGKWWDSPPAQSYQRVVKAERVLNEVWQAFAERIREAREKKQWDVVYQVAREARQISPKFAEMFRWTEAEMLIVHLGRTAKGIALILPLIEEGWDCPQTLAQILELTVRPGVSPDFWDKQLNEKIAQRIVELIDHEPDPMIREKFQSFRWLLLPPVAAHYFSIGQADRAVTIQTLALSSLTEESVLRSDLEADLSRYRALTPPPAAVAVRKEGVCTLPETKGNECASALAGKGPAPTSPAGE